MPKFLMQPLIGTEAKTARLGAGTGAANNLNDSDVEKPVKLVGESRYDLCAVGDPIEGFTSTVDTTTQDGYSTGGVRGDKKGDRMQVTFDGLQATPGAGVIAVGDYVVTGSVAAKGVKVPAGGPKVCKATQQPGVTEAAVVGDVNDMLKVALFAWRVVSLGNAASGAVGTSGVIERV